jgi:hypothetical protein
MKGELRVWIAALRREISIRIIVRTLFKVGGSQAMGCEYDLKRDREHFHIVALMYGDSENWAQFSARRSRPMPFFKAVGVIFRLSFPPIIVHLKLLAQQAARLARALKRVKVAS